MITFPKTGITGGAYETIPPSFESKDDFFDLCTGDEAADDMGALVDDNARGTDKKIEPAELRRTRAQI